MSKTKRYSLLFEFFDRVIMNTYGKKDKRYKLFDKTINREAKQLREHMKKSGWDLNADFIIWDVIGESLNLRDLRCYILAQIIKRSKLKNVRVCMDAGSPLLITKNIKKASKLASTVHEFYLEKSGKNKILKSKTANRKAR